MPYIRRLFFWGLVGTFLILSPLLILYVRGIRLSSDQQALLHTGTLVVSTNPRGVNVSLNDDLLKARTPLTFSAVTPGKYMVKLSKAGYLPWRKELEIRADEAVFISDVRMVKDELPILILKAEILNLFVNPKKTKALLFSKSNNKILVSLLVNETLSGSLALNELVKLPVASSTPKILAWSLDSDRVLLENGGKKSVLTLDIYAPEIIPLPNSLPNTTANFRWDNRQNDILYGSGEKNIFIINTTQKTVTPLKLGLEKNINPVISNFWLQDRRIVILLAINSRPFAYSVDLDSEINESDLISLPEINYRYLGEYDKYVLLLDKQKTLSLWDTRFKTFRQIFEVNNVNEASLDGKNGEILYTTPFELWTYNPELNKHDLLLRGGLPTRNPSWYGNNSHVLYILNDELYLIERDPRDIRNQWKLAKTERLINYIISPDNNSVYFAGRIGNQSGLFKRDF